MNTKSRYNRVTLVRGCAQAQIGEQGASAAVNLGWDEPGEEQGCELREAWFVMQVHTRCWEHIKGFDKCFKGSGESHGMDCVIGSDSFLPCVHALGQVTL